MNRDRTTLFNRNGSGACSNINTWSAAPTLPLHMVRGKAAVNRHFRDGNVAAIRLDADVVARLRRKLYRDPTGIRFGPNGSGLGLAQVNTAGVGLGIEASDIGGGID